MENLKQMQCEACSQGAPKLSEDEIKSALAQLPGWTVIDADGILQFRREFMFSNFLEAIVFLNKVGRLAEDENHHPAMLLEWGKVTVTWWTHKIRGLHRNDAIMSVKTNALYEVS